MSLEFTLCRISSVLPLEMLSAKIPTIPMGILCFLGHFSKTISVIPTKFCLASLPEASSAIIVETDLDKIYEYTYGTTFGKSLDNCI